MATESTIMNDKNVVISILQFDGLLSLLSLRYYLD